MFQAYGLIQGEPRNLILKGLPIIAGFLIEFGTFSNFQFFQNMFLLPQVVQLWVHRPMLYPSPIRLITFNSSCYIIILLLHLIRTVIFCTLSVIPCILLADLRIIQHLLKRDISPPLKFKAFYPKWCLLGLGFNNTFPFSIRISQSTEKIE